MLKQEKVKYKIIKEGNAEYILVSDVPAYARERFNSSFGIPSYRTIRHYVSRGILIRPGRLGHETYFEIKYIIGAIEIIRKIRHAVTEGELVRVLANAKKFNQFDTLSNLLTKVLGTFKSESAWEELIKQLSTKKPSDIDVEQIASKFTEPRYQD